MSELSELFARDPLSLTKEDITQVIEQFRKMRGQFTTAAQTAKAAPKRTSKLAQASAQLDLGEIKL